MDVDNENEDPGRGLEDEDLDFEDEEDDPKRDLEDEDADEDEVLPLDDDILYL